MSKKSNGTKALKNLGKSLLQRKSASPTHTAVDSAFEHAREKWDHINTTLRLIDRDIGRFEDHLKRIHFVRLSPIANVLHEFYNSSGSKTEEVMMADYALRLDHVSVKVNAALRSYLVCAHTYHPHVLRQATKEMQTEIRDGVQELSIQWHSYRKKIKTRDSLFLEYSKSKKALNSIVEKTQSGDTTHLSQAEQRYEHAKDAYEKYHQDLFASLLEIHTNRHQRFQIIYTLLVGTQIQMFVSFQQAFLQTFNFDYEYQKKPKPLNLLHNKEEEESPSTTPKSPKKDEA